MKPTKLIPYIAAVVVLASIADTQASFFTKARNAVTHPVQMVAKKIDQIGDVPKKVDSAADAAKDAANQTSQAAQDTSKHANSALDAGTDAANKIGAATAKVADQTDNTLKKLQLPLQVLAWGLAAAATAKAIQYAFFLCRSILAKV
jgi:hypothetical protein